MVIKCSPNSLKLDEIDVIVYLHRSYLLMETLDLQTLEHQVAYQLLRLNRMYRFVVDTYSANQHNENTISVARSYRD